MDGPGATPRGAGAAPSEGGGTRLGPATPDPRTLFLSQTGLSAMFLSYVDSGNGAGIAHRRAPCPCPGPSNVRARARWRAPLQQCHGPSDTSRRRRSPWQHPLETEPPGGAARPPDETRNCGGASARGEQKRWSRRGFAPRARGGPAPWPSAARPALTRKRHTPAS